MRRTITITAFLLASIIALVRTYKSTPLALHSTYQYLTSTGLTQTQYFVLSGILLALAATLFAICTKKYDFSEETILVFAATPALLTALILPYNAIILAILAVGIALVWEKNHIVTILTIFALLVSPSSAIIAGITIIMLIGRKSYAYAATLVVVLLTSIFTQHIILANTNVFFELGALGGASIFISMLAITGIFLWWNTNTYRYVLATAVLIFPGILIPDLRLVAAMAAAVMGGYALRTLSERVWRLESIRSLSILLVICGLLFTAAGTGAQAVRSQPSADFSEAVYFLQGISATTIYAQPDIVSTVQAYGISATSKNWKRIDTAKDVEQVKTFIEPKYILLKKENRTTRLLFFIENTDDFLLVRDGEYQVWEVLPELTDKEVPQANTYRFRS